MRTVRTAFIVLRLAEVLTSCKHAYYNGADGISDEDYDYIEALLMNLCPDHPILKVIGAPSIESYSNPSVSEVMNMMGIKYEES